MRSVVLFLSLCYVHISWAYMYGLASLRSPAVRSAHQSHSSSLLTNTVPGRSCISPSGFPSAHSFSSFTRLFASGEDKEEGEGEESIEDLVSRAKSELDADREASAQADIEKALRQKKIREDREYEKYWDRVTGKKSSKSLSKAQMTQKEYYGMRGKGQTAQRMDDLREMYSNKGLEVSIVIERRTIALLECDELFIQDHILQSYTHTLSFSYPTSSDIS